MSSLEILRDALFGNPPSIVAKPSREGTLAAFAELKLTSEAGIAAAALSGTNLNAAMVLVAPLLQSAREAENAARQTLLSVPAAVAAQIDQAVSEATEDAAASRDSAALSAAAASLSESGAVAANGTLYATVEAGQTATAIDGFFTVAGDGTNTYAVLYQRTLGGSTERARYPSKAAYEAPNGGNLIRSDLQASGSTDYGLADFSKQFVTATQFGITGTGDETASIQAAINYAASVRRPLLLDGFVRLSVTGLVTPSFTEIRLGTTELFLLNGSNRPILRNPNETFHGVRIDGNICITADTPINCNAANQNDVGIDGVWLAGVRFTGVDLLQVDFDVRNARRFSYWVTNCRKVFATKPISAIHADTALAGNMDGFHVNGDCDQIDLPAFINIGGNDDSVALNADDIPFGGQFTQANISGPIRNVNIGRIHHDGCKQGVRLLAAQNPLSNVSIGQMTGDVTNYAINIQDYGLGIGGYYESIRIGSINMLYKPMVDGEGVVQFVSIDTLSGDRSFTRFSSFEIGEIVRQQTNDNTVHAPTDRMQVGEQRNTLVVFGRNAMINIGRIEERNAANPIPVYIGNGGYNSQVRIGEFLRPGDRAAPTQLILVEDTKGNAYEVVEIGRTALATGVTNALIAVNAGQVANVIINEAQPLQFAVGAVPLRLSAGSIVAKLDLPRCNPVFLAVDQFKLDDTATLGSVQPARLRGPSNKAPMNPVPGQVYYDEGLGKPIVYYPAPTSWQAITTAPVVPPA